MVCANTSGMRRPRGGAGGVRRRAPRLGGAGLRPRARVVATGARTGDWGSEEQTRVGDPTTWGRPA